MKNRSPQGTLNHARKYENNKNVHLVFVSPQVSTQNTEPDNDMQTEEDNFDTFSDILMNGVIHSHQL